MCMLKIINIRQYKTKLIKRGFMEKENKTNGREVYEESEENVNGYGRTMNSICVGW